MFSLSWSTFHSHEYTILCLFQINHLGAPTLSIQQMYNKTKKADIQIQRLEDSLLNVPDEIYNNIMAPSVHDFIINEDDEYSLYASAPSAASLASINTMLDSRPIQDSNQGVSSSTLLSTGLSTPNLYDNM